ncbi:MAG: hypothetical protein HC876_01160 [Chloroflexaceae bacterium]|nr:hypothetical protein [Chloroflexaceae bacterium]NJO04244.1 hypothetical protein [Chloroflexaceae bacterium]
MKHRVVLGGCIVSAGCILLIVGWWLAIQPNHAAPLHTWSMDGPVRLVAVSETAALIVAADVPRDNQFSRWHLWSLDGQHVLEQSVRSPCRITALAFTVQGTQLAVGFSDGSLDLWDIAQQRHLSSPLLRLRHATPRQPSCGQTLANLFTWQGAAVASLAYQQDGRLLAIGSSRGEIQIVEVATGQVRFHFAMPPQPSGNLLSPEIGDLVFTPDEATLVFGARTGRLGSGRLSRSPTLWRMSIRSTRARSGQ